MTDSDVDAHFREWAERAALEEFEPFANAMQLVDARDQRATTNARLQQVLQHPAVRVALKGAAPGFPLPSRRRLAYFTIAVAALEASDVEDVNADFTARARVSQSTRELTLLHPELVGRYLDLELPLRSLDAVTAAIAESSIPVSTQIALLERSEGGGHPFRSSPERAAPEVAWVKERLAGRYEKLAQRESSANAAMSRAIAHRLHTEAQSIRDELGWGIE
ncbi:MAG: hypothetical protein ACOYNI_11320 [Acidimicrobiia bacterium]